jgi:sulfate transport system permease protein
MQTLARAIAEFGSIVVVAGNIPYHTLTAPVHIYGEVESGSPETAAAVSLVLLISSLALSFGARALRGRRA